MSRRLLCGVVCGCAAAFLLTACGGDDDASAPAKAPVGSGGGGGSSGTSAMPEPACDRGACQCNDGLDNDGDGLVDWQQDLGCTARDDNSEGGNATGVVEDGWTVLEPAAGAQIIYVSSSVGDDSFDGLAPDPGGGSGPKQSIGAAVAAARDKAGDWVLLRRGDTFQSDVGLRASGASLASPFVLAGYGESTEFPTIQGIIKGSHVDNVVVAGLNVVQPNKDTVGIDFTFANHLLVEGNRIEGGNQCISSGSDATMQDWRIRRNVCIKPSNNGYFLTMIHDLLVDGNVIYRPGWDTANHAFYITRKGNENVTTRDNVILMDKKDRDDGDAIMQRPGGISEGNVVAAADWQGINFGACNDGDGSECAPPVPLTIRGNLLIDGGKLGGGISASVKYSQPGGVVADNLVVNAGADSASGFGPSADALRVEGNVVYNVQASFGDGNDMTWSKNVFFSTQMRPLVVADDFPTVTGFKAEENLFHATNQDPNNWFTIPQSVGFDGWQAATGETGSGDPFEFVDSSRTLATYNASLGGAADREAFFEEAIKQSRFAYRNEYTAPAVIAYFREGFTPR